MKKNIGVAVMNFFGLASLVALLDMMVARFNTTVFVQMFTRPAHLAFIGVLGLILAVAPVVRPRRAAAAVPAEA